MKKRISKRINARTRLVQKKYYETLKRLNGRCSFCDPYYWHHNVLDEHKYFYIIENEFPLSIFESRDVIAHLLVIPKAHFTDLSKFASSDFAELSKILAEYEPKGFTILAHAAQSPARTVMHQHTHLIKVK